MSWITFIWAMTAGICLTLGAVHFLVWTRQRSQWVNLVFAISAGAAAGYAVFDLLAMRAHTPAEYGKWSRWTLSLGVLEGVSLVWFIYLYLRAGRLWLLWLICALRGLMVVLNFVPGPNFFFREISGLQPTPLLGELISTPHGVVHPWVFLTPLCFLLIIVFVIDAARTAHRQGGQRQPWILGSVTVAAFSAALVLYALYARGVLPSAFASQLMLLFVLVIGYELSLNVLRAAMLARDLQASEAALRESEQRMELAARAAKLGLWVWDIPRNQIWASVQTRAFFGFAPTEPLNFERFTETVQADDQALVREAVNRAFGNGGDYECDYRMIGGAPERWIAARGRVEFGEDGKPVLMRGVSLDITARKEAEAELLEGRRELAHLSRVMMLGELSGSLAHELNQPLTAILSNAEAAQRFLEKGETTELRDILDDIVTADKHAGEVISRLRLLLKKGEVLSLPLDVNDAVQDVLKLMRSDLVNQGVFVEAALAPELPAVEGDRVQLQQVLLNLVINACDAMAGDDGADRRLVVRTENTPDGSVRVAVTDGGRGIPDGTLDRVFEPFFTTKAHGMGLGLSVCRTIIAAHGGELTAVNNAARGATFQFTLPGAKSAAV